jgi:hypothetical protein
MTISKRRYSNGYLTYLIFEQDIGQERRTAGLLAIQAIALYHPSWCSGDGERHSLAET